jgi:hypothetical protein
VTGRMRSCVDGQLTGNRTNFAGLEEWRLT